MHGYILILSLCALCACNKKPENPPETKSPSEATGAVSPGNEEAAPNTSGQDQSTDPDVECAATHQVTLWDDELEGYVYGENWYEIAEVSTQISVDVVGDNEVEVLEGDPVTMTVAVEIPSSCNGLELHCFEVEIYDAIDSEIDSFGWESELTDETATLEDLATGDTFESMESWFFAYTWCAYSQVFPTCDSMDARELDDSETREFAMTFPVTEQVEPGSKYNILLSRIQWVDTWDTNHYVYDDVWTQLTVTVTD